MVEIKIINPGKYTVVWQHNGIIETDTFTRLYEAEALKAQIGIYEKMNTEHIDIDTLQ